jgi:signal transduction histidine kinase
LSVVAGYVRMLLQDPASPFTDHQRTLLQKTALSCGHLTQVLAEMSELSQLELRKVRFSRHPVSLHGILTGVVEALPALPSHTVTVTLVSESTALVNGDAVRLRRAFSSIVHALRRELVTSDELVVRAEAREDAGAPSVWIAIGERPRIEQLLRPPPPARGTFNEWRGGNGLRLPNARRIIEAHGGRVWNVADDNGVQSKASAIVMLPTSG